MRILLVLALLAVGCGSSSPEPEPIIPEAEPGPAPEADPDPEVAPVEQVADPLLDADDFLFQWARGAGPVFVDQVSLRADGQLIWVRVPSSGGHPRALETRATDAEVAAVRGALSRAGFFALAPSYLDPGVRDGSQLILRVRAGGRTHRVSCDNQFPEGVVAVQTAVEALFTPAREAALAEAPEAQPEDFDPSLHAE